MVFTQESAHVSEKQEDLKAASEEAKFRLAMEISEQPAPHPLVCTSPTSVPTAHPTASGTKLHPAQSSRNQFMVPPLSIQEPGPPHWLYWFYWFYRDREDREDIALFIL